MLSVKPYVEIISMNEYKEILKKLEKIGRVCYKSEERIREGSAEAFLQGILKRGHESVIEHESVTLRIICDRGVSHEIVRHRLASYSQESTRYCNYTKDKFGNQISVIDIASGFSYDMQDKEDIKKYKIWEAAMEYAEKAYFDMLEAGASAQEARAVLPNSLKTEIVMTMNLREWRHFLKLRTAKGAHPQMREVANQILEILYEALPIFFQDLADAK